MLKTLCRLVEMFNGVVLDSSVLDVIDTLGWGGGGGGSGVGVVIYAPSSGKLGQHFYRVSSSFD